MFEQLYEEFQRIDPTTLLKQNLSVIEEEKETNLFSIFKSGSLIKPVMIYDEFVERTLKYTKNIASISSSTDDHFRALFRLLHNGNIKGFEAQIS